MAAFFISICFLLIGPRGREQAGRFTIFISVLLAIVTCGEFSLGVNLPPSQAQNAV
jgi:hypothetical protein